MSGHNPDQMHLSEVARLYPVVLYWALLITGVLLACWNLLMDPIQRTIKHRAIYVMRVLAAGMWYLETLWKLPGSVTLGFRYWMDQTVNFDSPLGSRVAVQMESVHGSAVPMRQGH
jgi:hypothetical protein